MPMTSLSDHVTAYYKMATTYQLEAITRISKLRIKFTQCHLVVFCTIISAMHTKEHNICNTL